MGRTYDHQWRRVRLVVLERDGWRCRIRGPKCTGDADEVDHIVPVEAGGSRLDMANLRAACGTCNRGRAARSKHRDGWRRSSTRIVLVVGPPGAGKSTLVAERASPSDLVVDYDRLAQALGSQRSHGHELDSSVTKAARGAVLTKLRRGDVDVPKAWIISANPAAETMFPYHELEVVDPGRDEVLRRCVEAGRPGSWAALVEGWYERRASVGVPVGASREW